LFLSASIDNQTTSAFHNTLRYGAARKREQYTQWAQVGSNFDAYGDSLGNTVTITGANGTTVTGQAILDYAGLYPSEDQLVNNRDQLVYQADYRLTPHLTALLGFHYENERGSYLDPAYFMDEQSGRTNYDYLAGFHGDFKNRFFYTLGGSVEKYSLFGLQGSPRLGLSYYALKPSNHIFSGTRLLFNYSDGVREPKLTDQFGSLYQFLTSPLVNLGSVAQQLHITALAAPTTRTYEGGVAQGFWGDRVVFRASYFHNQFGREIESVPAPTLLTLIPGLTQKELGVYYTYDEGLYVNTEAFRVQGFETTVESGIGHNLFLRGGYTYLDSLVQRSFSSDNQALLGGYSPTYNGIPIGAYSPLVGARPFRRPPHTGFITANYTEKKLTASLAATFSSRSDDSTYLLDANFGSSLLLPNRNLDFGYAKLDLGGNYQLLPWLSAYVQGQNLLSNQHIGPIGYPSLPFTARAGLRIALGKSNNH
jgi:iron complex outermembrane receptor protein/vitamin B12 transporter